MKEGRRRIETPDQSAGTFGVKGRERGGRYILRMIPLCVICAVHGAHGCRFYAVRLVSWVLQAFFGIGFGIG